MVQDFILLKALQSGIDWIPVAIQEAAKKHGKGGD